MLVVLHVCFVSFNTIVPVSEYLKLLLDTFTVPGGGILSYHTKDGVPVL